MNYAIVRDNTIIAAGTARQVWPNVSIPRSGPNAEFLVGQDAVEVISEVPYDSETQYLKAVEPYLMRGLVFDRVAEDRPIPPPQPRWQEFQGALLTDPQVHDMMMAAKDLYPGLISAWSTGLGQAATGMGHDTFLTTWNLARTLPDASGGAPLLPPALIEHIAALAVATDLPAQFVEGLNPPVITEE